MPARCRGRFPGWPRIRRRPCPRTRPAFPTLHGQQSLPYYYACEWPGNRATMKSIFIDCNNQLAPVFARVRRSDDPPIAVNPDAFSSADLPRLLAGYDICLDDHSYMPTEVMAECRGLKHIVFLGTGASSYMDVPALSDLGSTGREVVRIARGIGMEVIAWNRSPRPDAGVPLVALDDLLARADVISLHLALNDETRGLLDAKRLALAKPGVILVNTARGALVDENALIDAIERGHVRHAGLDVFHAEPLKPDHPLARMENVTLTSHAAFRTVEASMTLMRRAIDVVKQIVAPPPAA